MRPGPGEQPVSAWRAIQLADLAALILDRAGRDRASAEPRAGAEMVVDDRPAHPDCFRDRNRRGDRHADEAPQQVDLGHQRPGPARHLAAPGRPRIVAVDGRSGGGKSTLAQRLADAVPDSAIIHVDDIAWNAPLFQWADLLATGVLEPLRRCEAVSYRPPAWELHHRPGVIAVPSGRKLVIVEGVGAGSDSSPT